eukprot:14975796-Heterocapsa_arctica.AAC.1
MFVLGELSATCYHGWPAVEGKYTGTEQAFFELDLTTTNFKFSAGRLFFPIIMMDMACWEGIEYQWASPMHQWI